MKDSLRIASGLAAAHEDLFLPVSDYVLAALRRAFEATHETCVRWHITPAENGTTLMLPGGETVEVRFYRPNRFTPSAPEYAPATLVCTLNDMVVTVRRWPEGPDPAIALVIQEAHAEAYYLAMARPDRIQLLRLIQVDCSFEAPSPEERIAVGHEIAAKIGGLLGAEAHITFDTVLCQVARTSMEMDLEFALTDPLSEVEAAAYFTSFFPDMEPPLTGDGYIVINHHGDQCIDARVKMAHVTGRHFYTPLGES